MLRFTRITPLLLAEAWLLLLCAAALMVPCYLLLAVLEPMVRG